MKNKVKVRSILIAAISIFCFMFLLNFNIQSVSAQENEEYGSCETSEGTYSTGKEACKTNDSNGTVTITKGGMINVEYTHGITEILVYAEACSNYEVGDDGKPVCINDVWNGKKVILHASGDSWTGSKTIHLYKYFDLGALVRVKMIYEFANSKPQNDFSKGNVNTATSGFYNPLYCDLNIPRYECGRFYSNTGSDISDWKLIDEGTTKAKLIKKYSIRQRILEIPGFVDGTATTNTLKSGIRLELLDKKGIVYKGSSSSLPIEFNSSVNSYVIVSNTGSDAAAGDVEGLMFDVIIPALLIMLSIAATVTIIVLGVQIIKGADEAQEREDKIKRLRGIIIGIAIVFIILAAVEPISELLTKYLR